jgi:hypothetical protein
VIALRVTQPAPDPDAGPGVVTDVTRSRVYTVTGRVRPKTARVVFRPGAKVIGLRVVRGRFHATVQLHVGQNEFEVTARRPGFTSPDPTVISIRRRKPKPPPPPRPRPPRRQNCDSNYAGACVPVASDVDCEGGSGDGPAYVAGPVRVVGSDVYDLDRDGDGVGCDT